MTDKVSSASEKPVSGGENAAGESWEPLAWTVCGKCHGSGMKNVYMGGDCDCCGGPGWTAEPIDNPKLSDESK